MTGRAAEPAANPKSILVLRFGAAGDVLLTIPALEALRAVCPSAHIAFATKAAFAPLVQHHPAVNEVVPFEPGEGLMHFAERLRDLRCDALLDLHGNTRTRLLRRLVPASRKVVWQKRSLSDTLNVRLLRRTYHARYLIAA